MKNKLKILSLAIAILWAPLAQAAGISIQAPDGTNIALNEQTKISVQLSTQGKTINAFEGEITFNKSNFSFFDFELQKSITSLWITQPEVEGGTIKFSGMIPGGYTGDGAELFSFILISNKQGTAEIKLSSPIIYLNDGKGTEIKGRNDYIKIQIDKETSQETKIEAELDEYPPEPFELVLIRDEAILNGEPALFFQTQDKGSGVATYQISYNNGKTWEPVRSPVKLDKTRTENIQIKATDRRGNTRIETLENGIMLSKYQTIALFTITLFIIWAFIKLNKRRKKYKKKK